MSDTPSQEQQAPKSSGKPRPKSAPTNLLQTILGFLLPGVALQLSSSDTASQDESNATGSTSKSVKRTQKTNALASFIRDPVVFSDLPFSEDVEILRRKKLIHLINVQNVAIIVLTAILILGVPFFQTTYEYYAMTPEKKLRQLAPLNAPNLTNEAVLSWATTVVTEVMTVGFGDFTKQLVKQKPRFTTEGWDSFVAAAENDKLEETFKSSQLVMTTVPSDKPVITAQGEDGKGGYKWEVQLPVITTFMTNNNKSSAKRPIINLTIVRVPPEVNPMGLGIKKWSTANGG